MKRDAQPMIEQAGPNSGRQALRRQLSPMLLCIATPRGATAAPAGIPARFDPVHGKEMADIYCTRYLMTHCSPCRPTAFQGLLPFPALWDGQDVHTTRSLFQ